ncbi:MAG: hypothetical protein V1802_00105 [Candidatus Aenigmatarchaeota archaeon]
MSPLEKKILKKVSECSLITKFELRSFLKNNGISNDDIDAAMGVAINSLREKELIATLNPIGSTCLVITNRGNRFLDGL